MNMSEVKRRIKPWMLPIAMLGGIFCHDFIEKIAFLSPYLIFTMLLITFCKISIREFRVTRLSWSLLAIQVLGSLIVYFALLPFGDAVAQGAFICVFCPTATAAPVITGMLGGSISRLATFSIISNVAVAMLAPLFFTMMGSNGQVDVVGTMISICRRVMPMIVCPLVIALLLQKITPKLHRGIASKQSVSFYIWSVALFIVVGKAVSFVMNEPSEKIPEILLIAFLSGIVCCMQFYFGRRIGGRCGDKVVGGQGLGQKNTILAVWMSLTYLNPLSSIGPAAYVFWQNTINSWQLYRKQKQAK